MTAAASGSGKSRPSIARRGAGYDSPGLLTRLRRDALQALAAGPLYRHTLIGRVPADLRLRIAQRWPGDAKRGAAIVAGEIELAGELVRDPTPRWFPPSAGQEWLAAWHGFGWIADVAAAGAARAKRRAIWCKAGSPRIPGGTASDGGPMCWRRGSLPGSRISTRSRGATRTIRCAGRCWRASSPSCVIWRAPPPGRSPARAECGRSKALIAGIVVLGGFEPRMARVLKTLERELAVQILPDGGHRVAQPIAATAGAAGFDRHARGVARRPRSKSRPRSKMPSSEWRRCCAFFAMAIAGSRCSTIRSRKTAC